MTAGLEGLHKKAQKGIGAALEEDEVILVAEPGEDAALAATNRRIFICKWGMLSGAVFGSQINSWDLRNVTGIEYRKGMTTKAIVIQTAGTVPVSKFGRMDSGPGSVWQAPNALFVNKSPDGTVAKLRELVANHQNAAPAPVSAPSPVAEQIRALAALRDGGILTEEEFQAKKRQILGI